MIYAAFTLWLLLILFAGMGVYRLWSKLIPAAHLRWILLPGTIVSEMAYIFGCLITGGEVRRARLLPAPNSRRRDHGEPETETSGGLKIVSPIVAALLAILACVGAILLFRWLLGQQIIEKFIWNTYAHGQLPTALPASSDELWSQLELQIKLLRGMTETWRQLDWLDWRVPLYVYLTVCLSIRLGPVSKPMRPTLAAAVVIAALIGLAGAISKDFRNLMSNPVWPLLTYIWSGLLFLLVATLLIMGIRQLVRILLGKAGA